MTQWRSGGALIVCLIWKQFKVGWRLVLDAMMGLQAFQLAVQHVRDVSLQGERGILKS